jgi:nitronate monooxygenase
MLVDGRTTSLMPWADTELTRRLKIKYPIVQGPFGRGGSSALLTATVSNAGGLGSFGANDLSADAITKVAGEIRKLTDMPFGINLWVSTHDQGGDVLDEKTYQRVTELLKPYYKELAVEPPPFSTVANNHAPDFDEQVAALLEAQPAVFSFVFGIPPEAILAACKQRDIVTAGGASTVDEAIALDKAGVDFIVASGFEAGGHRPSFLKSAEESLMGTFSLVPRVVDQVSVPVIAAGGIADGRGVLAALTLGADAAQIGTAFLACDESGTSDLHRQILFQKEAATTGLSRSYTGRLARGISNKFAAEMKPEEASFAKYPAHSWIVAPLRAAALAQGRSDLIALWSGQSASLVRHHKADQLLAALVEEVETILNGRLQRACSTKTGD